MHVLQLRSSPFLLCFLLLCSVNALSTKSVETQVWKPFSLEDVQEARERSWRDEQCTSLRWERHTVRAPDTNDRCTLEQLARMAGNAYALPGQKNWYDMDEYWNTSFPVGWEGKSDGFRGHVFVSEDTSTVVLAIKGTTLYGGPTSAKDRFNDNLLFSCCCARVDFTWIFSTVCDCYSKRHRCDNMCLTEALIQDSLFYNTGVHLYANLTLTYPRSNIWLVGHSLGGALASLLGATFGAPAVAFESPGERLAAHRLHLPVAPYQDILLSPVTHVYHNADPIPQGACTGKFSLCAQAGYALETRCHLGRSIVYDTMGVLGWKVDVRKHVIRTLIKDVIGLDDFDWEPGRRVPEATKEIDCVDCYQWEFGDYKLTSSNWRDF